MKLDLRLLQIAFLASFLAFGVSQLSWDIDIQKILILIGAAILTQSLFCLAFNIPIQAVKSALITSLGLSIILRSNHEFIYAMAGFFAIGSKYIFRYHHKHFINPANFGIVFIVLFTGVAWVSPSQWGSGTVLFFIVGSLGLMMLSNLKKIDLALSFIVFYFGFDFLWNIVYKGLPLDNFIHNISNGSVVLFTFFMITDPSSTPNSRRTRIFWVFLISVLAFYLANFLYVKCAPLFSLFILSPLVPLLDHYAKEPLFSWDSMEKRELHTNAVSK